ncbi:MAG TPA: TlpA disulfide reductase family protein [Thermoanaerobaculia bacterium]|nr:TlpA disulfide reductase family protein [Thermoanaerobaculia bacterium]
MRKGQVVALAFATVFAALAAWMVRGSLEPYNGPIAFSAAAARAMKVQLPGGGTRDVSKPQGKLFVVHFWATWCEPCLEELPGLVAYAREIKNDPSVELLAVSVDDDLKTVSEWLKAHDAADLPVALDPGRKIATKMGTQKFPETYILSAKGDVLGHVKGPVDWTSKEIRAQIDDFRKGAGKPPVTSPS